MVSFLRLNHFFFKKKMPFWFLRYQFSLENFLIFFSETFGELLIALSTKVNLLYFLYLINGQEVLSSPSDKAKFFTEYFSKNSNLDDSGIS